MKTWRKTIKAITLKVGKNLRTYPCVFKYVKKVKLFFYQLCSEMSRCTIVMKPHQNLYSVESTAKLCLYRLDLLFYSWLHVSSNKEPQIVLALKRESNPLNLIVVLRLQDTLFIRTFHLYFFQRDYKCHRYQVCDI